jgi:hypothetical protein
VNAPPKTMLTTSLAILLVLGTAGGGIAYTTLTVDRADRTAAVKAWQEPKKSPSDDDPVQDQTAGRRDRPLSRELLPVPEDYRLGPDIAGYGNDAYLSAAKAEALFNQGTAALPNKARKEHREYVRTLDVQGMAMRSYSAYSHDLVVEIQLAQMSNRGAVKDLNVLQSAVADALSLFREGPEIEGYEAAKCYLMPEDDPEDEGDTGAEEMVCTAHEDDVLVSLTATGPGPLRKKEAAEMLKKQLDRLTKGGGLSV